jgi:hypothetical protein
MLRLLLLVTLAMAAPAVVAAQGLLPSPPYYATNPNQPLAPSPQSPVQQQLIENYRTQLLQTQREMLQQNPSGLSREQIEVGRQLNTVYPSYNPANPGYVAPPPPRYNPVRPYYVPPGRIPETWVYWDKRSARRDSEATRPKHRRVRAQAQRQQLPKTSQ